MTPAPDNEAINVGNTLYGMNNITIKDTKSENTNDAAFEILIKKIRIVADGIPSSITATTSDSDVAQTLKNLKASLFSLASASPGVTAAEIVKAESVLQFMILPSMEDCLELWFGKSKETDERIWSEFAEDVAKASMGLYEHWSYAVEYPHMIVALVIYLDQFRRNMFRGTRG